MTATVPITLPPASTARRLRCDLCWALPGKPCTVSGPPGNHLARIITAVKLGLLSPAELTEIVAGIDVIADHVVIVERAE